MVASRCTARRARDGGDRLGNGMISTPLQEMQKRSTRAGFQRLRYSLRQRPHHTRCHAENGAAAAMPVSLIRITPASASLRFKRESIANIIRANISRSPTRRCSSKRRRPARWSQLGRDPDRRRRARHKLRFASHAAAAERVRMPTLPNPTSRRSPSFSHHGLERRSFFAWAWW